jgi:multidrug resistance efflux pump
MKARRFRALFWLLTAAVLLVGLTGAAVAFRLPSVNDLFESERPNPGLLGLEGVECLGRVDIEGSLLDLASVRPGRVVAVPVREGETVSAGAVLLRLDEQPARLQIQTARAALEAARTQVALANEAVRVHPSRVAGQEALVTAARSRVTAAREELRRKERLHDQGLIGKEERDSAREEVKALESMTEAEGKRLEGLRAEEPDLRVKLAGAEVARATALLAEAQYALEQCVVTAPAAGRVLQVRCGAGVVVSPQAAVIVFAPEKPRIVRAEVEQEFIHFVEVGQPAVVRDEMNAEWSWKGNVARIGDWYRDSPSIPRRMVRFTDMPTVECVIALDQGHPPLRIGQRMSVFLRKVARPPARGATHPW